MKAAKLRRAAYLLALVTFLTTFTLGQVSAQLVANPDVFCFQAGQTLTDNVLDNDNGFTDNNEPTVIEEGNNPCFRILPSGQIVWNTDAYGDCCGVHTLHYFLVGNGTPDASEPTSVEITVKCDKPNCDLVDLSAYTSQVNIGNQEPLPCVNVCENSEVTFFVPWSVNSTYSWSVISGGAGFTGSNPAEFIVNWGSVGSGYLSLVIDGVEILICIDILPAPVASFTTPGYACLDQCLQFTNTSSNASSYYWDFGDGNNSDMENPCHTYANPGVYTVTLIVTNQNDDEAGNPLCCCRDSVSVEVEIDELPGPGIFWISTLCEGDESCYWTDAANCASYAWTVLDGDGVDITASVTGQNTDTICLTWGSGPVGTITLAVTGCDSTYCDNPTTVNVPIIPATTTIDGPIVVCAFSNETYSLPKWLSTAYSWTVTGGNLSSAGGGNVESINWGPPGNGTIQVNYVSDFLACLPGHEPGDCAGTAYLDVLILPSFTVVNNGPGTVCVGNTSTISATSSPLATYNWSISPSVPFGGQGSSNVVINWTSPGTYVISAEPTDTISYCNSKASVVVKVIDVPQPLGITGPTDICPGDAFFYTAQPGAPGFGYSWTATNGVLTASTGATVEVTWGAVGPYVLTVSHTLTSAPFCAGPPFVLNVTPKGPNGPYNIQGNASCLNDLNSYTLVPTVLVPPPHPDIQYVWSLSDPTLGSIVSGQGSTGVQVQWGNTPGNLVLKAEATLCGVTVTTNFPISLTPTQVPAITQTGLLCPGGGSVTLTGSPGFSSYLWSDATTGPSTTTSSGGIVSLTTIDPVNNCPATVFKSVATQPGPVANIYSTDGNSICLQNPTSITMFGQTNPNYQFTWYCSGPSFTGNVLVQGPSTSPSYTHNFIGVLGVYSYYFVVQDLSTGCTKTSLPYIIEEKDCEGEGEGCTPVDHSLSANLTTGPPDCDEGSFSYSATGPFVFSSWNFGNGDFSSNPSSSYIYPAIGCYNAQVCGLVPEFDSPGDSCVVCAIAAICVPLKADFEFSSDSCGKYQFTDFSTFLPGPGNGIVSFEWRINNVLVSTLQNPILNLTPGLTANVELTVTNGNGCVSKYDVNITPPGVGTATITAPVSVCMDEAFNFSANAPGAVTYSWTFGISGTFGLQAGQFAYSAPPTIAGPNTISLIVSDNIGCQVNTSVPITVYPAVPAGLITAAPGLIICQGETTTLSGPAGYTYLWSPGGQTSQSISVGAGTYGLLITDANGCTRELDPVEVEELPLPAVSISGNLFICDAGCTLLSTPLEAGNTYQWLNDAMLPISGATGHQLQVCDFDLLPSYSVMVTDLNGCTNTAGPVTVQVAVSPSFTVVAAPVPTCAGQPNTLTVTPVEANVSYQWSTGANATSIVVSQAGTYTVVGTNSISGCSSSGSATVNPLPDLCIVPEGCYDICPPKTICGPPGLDYQWNLNGSPIAAETDSCLTITTSGNYSLTATNSFGCTTTSGQLILNIIDCPATVCDSLSFDFDYLTDALGEADSCCVSLSYTNLLGGIKGISIYTNDADLSVDVPSIHNSLTTQSITASSVALASSNANGTIPAGILADFIKFCVVNPTVSPQVIYIEWIDSEFEAICKDSIVLHCPVEPACIYVTNDTITCEPDGIFHTFTVCNPASAAYSIGYIDILLLPPPLSPPGLVKTPNFIDITGNPILPGNCASFTVQLSGPGIEGQSYCYNLVGHEFNPIENPASLCCSLDTLYCVDIPYCDPCPFVMVEAVLPGEGPTAGDDCCFDILLINDFVPGYFDEIALCMLSPATSFTINNPWNSGWATVGYTGTEASFLPNGPGGFPNGAFSLPTICVQTNTPPFQLLEIKWMKDGVVECRDTVSLFCEPDCGYITDENVVCDAGIWVYQGQLKNTSTQVVNEAYISFNSPSGLGAFNITVPLGTVNPGATSAPFSFVIGAPAMPGDTVCFTVTLHNVSSDGTTLECCAFDHCVVLPDCVVEPECLCDETFFEMVDAGFTVSPGSGPYTFNFTPVAAGYFGGCDVIKWTWGPSFPTSGSSGSGSISHTFPGPGNYKVCMQVFRTLPDGSTCKRRSCIMFNVPGDPIGLTPDAGTIYPNPNNGAFQLQLFEDLTYPLHFIVQDYSGRVIDQVIQDSKPANNSMNFKLGPQAPGMYVLRFYAGDQLVVRKFVVQ